MPDNYVTIGRYQTPMEAELAKMTLEAAEIPVFLVDSMAAGMLCHLPSVGRVRLQVHEEHADRAKEILEAEPIMVEEDIEAGGFPEENREPVTVSSQHLSKCPGCGSDRIEVSQSLFRALFGLLFGIFVETPSTPHEGPTKNWRCLRCGHRWLAP